MTRTIAAASYRPHKCVILAIDPGKVSGWAIFIHGRYVISGVARTLEDRQAAVAKALEVAGTDLPLVVVGESWTTGGKFGGHRTQAGLSEQWGIWRAFAEAHVPARRILRALPAQWWSALGLYGRMGHDALKQGSRKHAARVTGRPFEAFPEDEADAIGIGTWAVRAPAVLTAITPRAPKKRRTAKQTIEGATA